MTLEAVLHAVLIWAILSAPVVFLWIVIPKMLPKCLDCKPKVRCSMHIEMGD